jgi:hypothetical protein
MSEPVMCSSLTLERKERPKIAASLKTAMLTSLLPITYHFITKNNSQDTCSKHNWNSPDTDIAHERSCVTYLVFYFCVHKVRCRILISNSQYFEIVKMCPSSPSIARVIKARRMRWAGHVAHGRSEGCIQHFGWEAWREETTRKT